MCCVRKWGRERERGRGIRGGWKRQFRHISANGYWLTGRNAVRFSAEDDNNKRLWSAGFKLERAGQGSLHNGPLPDTIFQYPAPFFAWIMDHLGRLSLSLLLSLFFIGPNAPVIRNARKMNFPGIFREAFRKINCRHSQVVEIHLYKFYDCTRTKKGTILP